MFGILRLPRNLAFVFALVLLAISPIFAQQTKPALPVSKVRFEPLPPAEVDRIIRTFSAQEAKFYEALNNYSFKRDVSIRTLGILGGQITGEFRLVSRFYFDSTGNRHERVLFAPLSTLTDMTLTQEDLDDLNGVQPYALAANKINQYNFTYIGKEKIDQLDLFVFEVNPKNLDSKNIKERFFQGRIWVDDHDLMIVKVRGKAVPEGKQRFPTFETYREQIDGKHWFPTYTHSDEELVFPNGARVHEQMTVKYTEYSLGRTGVKIIDDDNSVIDDSDKPAPTTSPVPAPSPATPTAPKKP